MRLTLPSLRWTVRESAGKVREPVPRWERSGARRRRARWSLIAACVIFLASQLALGWGSEFYPRIRDPFYGDKLVKLQRRIARKEAPLVLMLGSSRTGLAFHGKRIEQRLNDTIGLDSVAFNFGIPASGPVTHLIYLRRMERVQVQPDLLLLEIMPTMLAHHDDGPQERHWLTGDRLTRRDIELAGRLGFPREKLWNDWRDTTWNPWYELRFKLLARVVQSWIPWQYRSDWSRSSDECGWGRIERDTITDAERRDAIERARLEYAALLSQLRMGGPAVQALKELLADCQSRRIPVKLMLMPLSTEFRSWYPPKVEQDLQQFLEGLSQEFGCESIDARNWLQQDQFSDGHHMLVRGSESFSDQLADRVLASFLKRHSETGGKR